jgi:hypothetical protein
MRIHRFSIICVLFASLLIPSVSPGADRDGPLLGETNLVAELGGVWLQNLPVDDQSGVYMGISLYRHLGNEWYLGGSYGAGASVNLLSSLFGDASWAIRPLELNLKRSFPFTQSGAFSLGGGVSYNLANFRDSSILTSDELDIEERAWLPGGQIFAELAVGTGVIVGGFRAAYQVTSGFDELGPALPPGASDDYANVRVSFQVGFRVPGDGEDGEVERRRIDLR